MKLLKYEDYANNELECFYGCRHVHVERDEDGYPTHRHGWAGYREHHPMVPIGEAQGPIPPTGGYLPLKGTDESL